MSGESCETDKQSPDPDFQMDTYIFIEGLQGLQVNHSVVQVEDRCWGIIRRSDIDMLETCGLRYTEGNMSKRH